jgi:hypothetical protein
MKDESKTPNKPVGVPKNASSSHKPAIRLDDLIPTEKVMGGRRITFGVRVKPSSKS